MIGAGKVATALAILLERAGHRILAVAGREATRQRAATYLADASFHPMERAGHAARLARLVVLGVPDDVIEEVCTRLAGSGAFAAGHHVLHLSGSVGLEALASARSAGAEVLSLHPLQSFPDVDEGIARLAGSAVAVTAHDDDGFEYGEALAIDLGGKPFRLADEVKPLYHAAAVFCANYLVAVEGMAERLFRLAGLEDPLPLFQPLARSAFDSTFSRGPGRALTGPASRGDAGTVARNLEALAERAPDAVPAYVALARVAASLAVGAGTLGSDGLARLEEVLERWT